MLTIVNKIEIGGIKYGQKIRVFVASTANSQYNESIFLDLSKITSLL